MSPTLTIPPSSGPPSRWRRVLASFLGASLALAALYGVFRGVSRGDWWLGLGEPLLLGAILFQWFCFAWPEYFPHVLTASPEGIWITRGAFPFRQHFLIRRDDLAMLHQDISLVLVRKSGGLRSHVALGRRLNDEDFACMVTNVTAFLWAQGIALEPQDAPETAGGKTYYRFWKG